MIEKDVFHTESKAPHLESEPLFLSADDPETEGLLRVGPRQDEFMNLLHHPLCLISLAVISVGRILLIRRKDGGMSE